MNVIDHKNNNNTFYIEKECIDHNEKVKKNDFACFIREKRKEYNEYHSKQLSTEDLGNILGINYEMFRKILNQQKPRTGGRIRSCSERNI